MTHRVLLAIATSALLGVSGCDRPGTPATDMPPRDEFAVQFDPTVGTDSSALRAALIAFGDSVGLTHFQATVRSMGGSPTRYLTFLIPPPTFNGGRAHFALLTADRARYAVEKLFDTGVPFGPVGIAIQSVGDLDADGLPDVHYCDYRSETGSSPVSLAVGYRNGAWYEIPAASALRCAVPERQ
jgi:hypothetical protein